MGNSETVPWTGDTSFWIKWTQQFIVQIAGAVGGWVLGLFAALSFSSLPPRVFLEALDPKAQLAPLEKKEKRWEM